MSLEINYKGDQIAQLTAGGTVTLKTAGKYVEGDIEAVYTGGGSGLPVIGPNMARQWNCIVFSSEEAFTLSFYNNSVQWRGLIYYKNSDSDWATWNGDTLTAPEGYIALRGEVNDYVMAKAQNVGGFMIQGKNVRCDGNLETILDYTKVAQGLQPSTASNGVFWGLFRGCTALISAPDLCASTLKEGHYEEMFKGCTSLLYPPALRAGAIYGSCYRNMFNGCTSLRALPEIAGITSLSNSCCRYMFSGCSSIKLSETKTGEYQYAYRIPSSGTVGEPEWAALDRMFENTGGTFVGTPTAETTYYTTQPPVPPATV